MTRSRYHSMIVYRRFPRMKPLRSPDRNVTEELASIGYWAAQEGDKLFLIIGYRPRSGIAERFDEEINRALAAPEWGVIEVEEYEEREEWRQRVAQLITPPDSGTEPSGAGVPRRPVPPRRTLFAAEPFPETG